MPQAATPFLEQLTAACTPLWYKALQRKVVRVQTKDLLIDWRWGEKYFAERLNDFDLSANNGGWQWAASTGCDAQPYFRIFNRYGQAVYEQRTCGNAVGWDGKYKGVPQNTGAYIYLWQGVSFEGEIVKGKGTVMLVR